MAIALSDGRKALYQWDTGCCVVVDEHVDSVHFANRPQGYAYEVDAVEGCEGRLVARIPDELAQVARPIMAWAFVGSDGDGYTKVEQSIPVEPRTKPAGYVFDPTSQKTIKDAERARDEAVAAAGRAEQALGRAPYIGENKHWFEWDEGAGAFADTGVLAEGKEGAGGGGGISSAEAEQLPEGSAPTASVEGGVLRLGIPRGEPGSSIRQGTGAPSVGGRLGDLYVDASTGALYEYQQSGQ